jgi:hypothetical protein
MRSNASLEEKQKIADEFVDFDYIEVKKETENANKAVHNLVTSEEHREIINKNEQVMKTYKSYLFASEEAEYMYPHAKGAVSVFLRDNAPSNEK